jgi:mRNA-degrading endonuclease RelE of RelBE toxin-antitoxin system
VKSELSDDFIECFKELPENIKTLAKKNYQLWVNNPEHPGLNFKKVKSTNNIYSIRIGIGWRALGILKNKNTIVWFWIGSHGKYDSIIKTL